MGGVNFGLPKWIKPQLTRLVDEAPSGRGWLHEIKYNGYRMHALHERADICLVSALTATCNEAGIVSRVVDGAVGLGLAFV